MIAVEGSLSEIANEARRRLHWADLVSAAVALVSIGLIVLLSGERTYFGYGTETDFVGSMIAEGQRLLSGEPLASEFHPPGYIMVATLAYLVSGEWFVAGKALSALSAALALLACHGLFRLIGGPVVALGAVIGLSSSATFLEFAMQATSDVYFLAIFYVTLMLAALAFVRRAPRLWLLVGALVVIVTMTRTNGITLLLLLGLPLIPGGGPGRLRALAFTAAGAGLAALAFLAFAQLSGSNLMPKGTFHNIAMTYFTDERISWEGMTEARSRFQSLRDVLTYDPAAMARGYASDLLDVTLRQIPQLGGPVLAMFFLPGLLIAIGDRQRPLLIFFLVLMIAQLLLVNLKAYEPRYHLYVTPWLGAGTVLLLSWLAARQDWPRWLRVPVVGLCCAAILVGLLYAWTDARRFAAQGGNPELARALPEIQPILTSDDVIMGRKSGHLAYYTDARPNWIPEVATEDDLRAALDAAAAKAGPGGRVFLFFGEIERRARRNVGPMLFDPPGLPWLERVAGTPDPASGWALFRYLPER